MVLKDLSTVPIRPVNPPLGGLSRIYIFYNCAMQSLFENSSRESSAWFLWN
jgi:hypothetical protein